MHDQLYSFFIIINEKIITNQQSGFRSLTLLSLERLIAGLSLYIAVRNVNAMVFLDLKKAFDTVDRDVVLARLSLYGLQETTYDWFKSYLNNLT